MAPGGPQVVAGIWWKLKSEAIGTSGLNSLVPTTQCAVTALFLWGPQCERSMVSIATGEAGAELPIASAPEQVFYMRSTVLGGSHVFSLLILLKARGRGYWCCWMERGRPPGTGRAKHESPELPWRRMNGPPRRTGSQCSEALDPGFGGSLQGVGGTAMEMRCLIGGSWSLAVPG